MTRDQREMGERLGVAHERRAPPNAALERQRRCERRLRGAPVQVVHERRLLAGDVARGGSREAQPRAGAPGALCAFVDRGLHLLGGEGGLLADGDDRLVGTQRFGGEDRAVEHEVGERLEQHAVLQARRLGLDGVHDDDRAPARAGDRAQLDRGREGGASAAGQPGALYLVDQERGALARAPARARKHARQRPVQRLVLVE